MTKLWKPATRQSERNGVSPRQRGVVLLAVIVCLTIAAFAAVRLARRSLTMATQTVHAKRQLQQRWATRSSQMTLLEIAPDVFEQIEKELVEKQPDREGPFPAEIAWTQRFGTLWFDVVLQDESAKVDLNIVYHYSNRAGLQSVCQRLLGPRPILPVRVQTDVRSAGVPEGEELEEPLPVAFRTWGQIFDFSRIRSPQAIDALYPLTKPITCWTDGQINVRRAPQTVIEQACQSLVSPSDSRQLAEDIRDPKRPHVHQLIDKLGMAADKQVLLKNLLTERSSCYSVWMTHVDGKQRRHSLAVRRIQEDTLGQTQRFEF